MTSIWRWVLAFFHWSDSAVCELSTDWTEFHDYRDSTTPIPEHFFLHTCRRCGRNFLI